MHEPEIGSVSSTTQETEPLTWKFWRKRRYIVVLLAFFGYVSVYTLRVNLSVAIVAMTENRTVFHDNGAVGYEQYFKWNSQERGLVLSSFHWGYIITQLVGGILAKRFSGSLIFGLGIGLTAILSLLTPLLGTTVATVIVIRVTQGLCGGVTFPCIYNIWFYWAPKPERSRMTSIAYAGMYIGTAVTMPITAYLTTWLGWKSSFYVFGSLGLVWYAIWIITVRSSPDKDPYISDDEMQYIQSTVDVEQKEKSVIPPWKAFLTSKPVYAITIIQLSLNWADSTMLTQMPTFLGETLHYDLGSSGSLSAAPYLAKGILIAITGYLADMLISRRSFTITNVRKCLICSSSVLQAICMTLVGFVIHPLWTVFFIVVGVGTAGICVSGYSGNAQDVAPDFASVIIGFSSTISCLTGILSPIVTGLLVQNKAIDEWRIVFYITGGMHLIGGVAYLFWGSGKLQSWSQVQISTTDNKST